MKIYFHHTSESVTAYLGEVISLDKSIQRITFGIRVEYISLKDQKVIWLRDSKLEGKITYPRQYESMPICIGQKKTTKQCDTVEELLQWMRPSGKEFDIIAMYSGPHFIGSAFTSTNATDLIKSIIGLEDD